MRNVPGVGGKTALALLALGTFALPASAAPSAAMEGWPKSPPAGACAGPWSIGGRVW